MSESFRYFSYRAVRTWPTPKAPKITAKKAAKKSVKSTLPSSKRVAPTFRGEEKGKGAERKKKRKESEERRRKRRRKKQQTKQ